MHKINPEAGCPGCKGGYVKDFHDILLAQAFGPQLPSISKIAEDLKFVAFDRPAVNLDSKALMQEPQLDYDRIKERFVAIRTMLLKMDINPDKTSEMMIDNRISDYVAKYQLIPKLREVKKVLREYAALKRDLERSSIQKKKLESLLTDHLPSALDAADKISNRAQGKRKRRRVEEGKDNRQTD